MPARDTVFVEFVGDRFDTEKPWIVHGGQRANQMSVYRTKTEAKNAAKRLTKRYERRPVVEKKNGVVGEKRDYRSKPTRGSGSGGLLDGFGL